MPRQISLQQSESAVINYAQTLGIKIEPGNVSERIRQLANYAQAMERQTVVESGTT